MKLHLGCGDIYLKDYINVDINGKYVLQCNSDEIERNATTLDKYFKYTFGSERRNIILDKKMDLLKKWDFANESVDEIVMVSVIEHVSHKDAKFIVNEIQRVLKVSGKVLIDFPDLKNQFLKYYETNPEFYMELVYCNYKNEFSIHRWGYTEETFKKLFGDRFSYNFRSIVNHDYPMIGCEVTKLV